MGDVFGLMYNPPADYLPIFQAILNLLGQAQNAAKLLQAMGNITIALFSTLFAAVLASLSTTILAVSSMAVSSKPAGRALLGVGAASILLGVCNVALAALAAPTGGAALAAQAALNACSGFFILGAAALGAGGVIAQTGQQTAAISFNLSNTAGRWRIFALSLL